jgi:hypothetical protein
MKEIDAYFKSYPNAEQLHETADGQVFLEKAKAQTHAQRLSDVRIITHVRARVDKTISAEDAAAMKAEAAAKAKERLLTLDFTADPKTFEQPELLQLAKALEVVTPDNKKATLIAALYELQARLATNG